MHEEKRSFKGAKKKHCQRHNGPKASSFHLTPLNLQQALKPWSNFSLVLFGKGQENIVHLFQIHVITLTNPFNNLEKSVYQF